MMAEEAGSAREVFNRLLDGKKYMLYFTSITEYNSFRTSVWRMLAKEEAMMIDLELISGPKDLQTRRINPEDEDDLRFSFQMVDKGAGRIRVKFEVIEDE